MPKVTVIVPNYNHARFLPQRLDSVLAQTFKDYELIVLDDASSDGSRAVLEQYAGKNPMRLVLNEKNSGSPFAQWQKGAALAAGEYLWIAESDDFASPNLLARLVDILSKNPQVGLAYCQSHLVDEKNRVTGTFNMYKDHLDPSRWEKDYINNGSDEIAHFLFRQNTIPNASAVLVRTALLISACERAGGMRLTGDWWTWVEVLLQSDVAFIAEPLNFFRMHSSSVRNTTKLRVYCEECFRVMAHISRSVKIDPASRRKALKEAFDILWAYLDSPSNSPDPQLIRKVLKEAEAIHWTANARLSYLKMKRQVKRIPFLVNAVRHWRRFKLS